MEPPIGAPYLSEVKGEKPLKVYGTLDDVLQAAMRTPEPPKAISTKRRVKKRAKKAKR